MSIFDLWAKSVLEYSSSVFKLFVWTDLTTSDASLTLFEKRSNLKSKPDKKFDFGGLIVDGKLTCHKKAIEIQKKYKEAA